MTTTSSSMISVITPVFDRAANVGDAIASVLAQTHRDVEHVVVDDGSTDGTLEVLHEIARSDDRVRVLQQSHAGPSAARNLALTSARGEHVAFLDSDDLMPPARLEHQVRYLAEHEDIDAVFGTEEHVIAPGVVPPEWVRGPAAGPQYCWSTILVERAEVVAAGGFDESLWSGEDTDLTFRLRERGVRMTGVEDLYLVRRFFGDNLTYAAAPEVQTLLESVRRHLARGSERDG